MIIDFGMNWENFYTDNIVGYIKSLQQNPFELITLMIDIAIVIFLFIFTLRYDYSISCNKNYIRKLFLKQSKKPLSD